MKKIVAVFLGILLLIPASPLQADSRTRRTLKVKVAVSPGFKANREWKQDFERRLAYASRIFDTEFKIKLQAVSWEDWTPANDLQPATSLMEDLRGTFPLHDADVVIGLLRLSDSVSPAQGLDTLGYALPFSGYLILRYPQNRLFKVQEETLLIHELGHLFGAAHTKSTDSIMAELVARQLPTRFDDENREIIMRTRDIDFRKGMESVPQGVLYQLLGSYVKLTQTDQQVDFYYTLGVFYLHLEQYKDAIEAWKKAISLNPENARFHYDLGILYLKIEKEDEAVSELKKAISGMSLPSQSNEKGKALSLLGQVYMNKEDWANAYSIWIRALTVDPKNLVWKMNLATVLRKTGQFDNALQQYKEIFERDKSNSLVRAYIGISYFETKNYNEALQYLKPAVEEIKKKPGTVDRGQLAEIYTYLGKASIQTNKKDEGVEYFSIACQLASEKNCHKQLAKIYFQMENWQECIEESATVFNTEKDDADIYGMMGVSMLQLGQHEKAFTLFQEGLKYAKTLDQNAKFHRNMGNIFLQVGNYDSAITEFEMAIQKDWKNVESHLGLALSKLGKQDLAAARNSLKNTLNLKPDHPKAKELLAKIEQAMSQQKT